MKKPCDNCSINIQQAMWDDEITCYRSCEKWKQWSRLQSKAQQSGGISYDYKEYGSTIK